ncbi:hypothetical protein X975_12872, partial [Stegodyphus mimosarum]
QRVLMQKPGVYGRFCAVWQDNFKLTLIHFVMHDSCY